VPFIVDWKIFVTVFGTVFVAELGDKTQLATMLFATDKDVSKYTVFLAASAALIVASGLGVLAGTLVAVYINPKYLHYAAGAGFIAIGAVTLYNA
jgi:putative Ca2+/H+ antiporter (TMEM165/GDT1 family)